jgi:hypothetical protein
LSFQISKNEAFPKKKTMHTYEKERKQIYKEKKVGKNAQVASLNFIENT